MPEKFQIGDDLAQAAQVVIQKKGYLPIRIFVHPNTPIGDQASISVTLGGETHRIPLVVRPAMQANFSVALNEAMMDFSPEVGPE